MTEQLLTLAEVAAQLRTTEGTVRRWINSGKLRATKPGGQRLVRQAWIDDMVERRAVDAPAPRSPRRAASPAPSSSPTGSGSGSFTARAKRRRAA